MTPEQLAIAAKALFGFDFRWQRPLARVLSTNSRLVRRWVAGDRPIRHWVGERIEELARERIQELEELVASLREMEP